MENMIEYIMYIQVHWADILNIVTYGIAATSIIVKLTPSLKDDNFFLPIVKFLGKFIALNTNAPTVRPK